MIRLILISLVTMGLTTTVLGQSGQGYNLSPNNPIDTSKKSVRCMAYAAVDKDTIRVVYHSPAVRKRIIWGGLVPWGDVWVTGAHSATRLDMPLAFEVNGVRIPAGQYALFSIPGETSWTLIINRNWQQHLTDDYDPKDDIVRITVQPEKGTHLERLEYFIRTDKKQGSISMGWEKVKVTLPFRFE